MFRYHEWQADKKDCPRVPSESYKSCRRYGKEKVARTKPQYALAGSHFQQQERIGKSVVKVV